MVEQKPETTSDVYMGATGLSAVTAMYKNLASRALDAPKFAFTAVNGTLAAITEVTQISGELLRLESIRIGKFAVNLAQKD